MKEFYILQNSGKGCFQDGNYCYPVDDKMVVQNALVCSEDKTFPPHMKKIPHFVHDSKFVFLEMTFDPISRVKRGKFYSLVTDEAQPCSLYQYSGQGGIFQVSARSPETSIQAYKFRSYEISRDFDVRKTYIVFGNSRIESRWRIITIDAVVTNEEVYVLQEVNSLGSIPSLNKITIPSEYYLEIEKEYSVLLSELNFAPETVVDHCRDVVTSLLSAQLGNISKENRSDLGKLIAKINDSLKIVKSSAEIINRLHPRRKPNEKDKHDLNELSRADADFAVQCVFQIIRELKWSEI